MTMDEALKIFKVEAMNHFLGNGISANDSQRIVDNLVNYQLGSGNLYRHTGWPPSDNQWYNVYSIKDGIYPRQDIPKLQAQQGVLGFIATNTQKKQQQYKGTTTYEN